MTYCKATHKISNLRSIHESTYLARCNSSPALPCPGGDVVIMFNFLFGKIRSDRDIMKLELKIHNESACYCVRCYTNVMRETGKEKVGFPVLFLWLVVFSVLEKNRYE